MNIEDIRYKTRANLAKSCYLIREKIVQERKANKEVIRIILDVSKPCRKIKYSG